VGDVVAVLVSTLLYCIRSSTTVADVKAREQGVALPLMNYIIEIQA
jgi:hypothetical protein